MSEDPWKKIASKLTYCHGTTSKFINSIKKYGIIPRKIDGIRPSVYEKELESKHLDAVYLSRWEDRIPGFCSIAADRAAEKFGGEPVVVNVKLNPEDFDRFLSDEDSWSEDYRPLFKSQCEWSMETGQTAACLDAPVKKAIEEAINEGLITKEQACNPPKWFAEIACFTRFALKGGVSPDKITGVKSVEEIRKKWEK
jgi:hypothetical protein